MHPTSKKSCATFAAVLSLVLASCSGASTTSSAPEADGSSTPPLASSTTTTEPPATTTTNDGPVSGSSSGPISVTESGTVIENVDFTGNGDENCVTITGASNVTVRNSRFTDCYKGVYAVNSSNVVVTDNVFEANMPGRGRNAVQFDKVSGGHVARNRSTVGNGATQVEDHISIYQSNGTSSDPIIVESNDLSGGGPSTSGSGIMLGDNGGSWQVARRNVLRDPGQVGIGASGGSHITVTDNTVSSSSHSWSNVGIYAWDWKGAGCSDVTIAHNRVEWTDANGAAKPFWDGGNCSNLTVSDNSWQTTGEEPSTGYGWRELRWVEPSGRQL